MVCLLCGGSLNYDFKTAIYYCFRCHNGFTQELMDDVTIIRGAFSQLLKPGLRAALQSSQIYTGKVWHFDDAHDIVTWIEEQEKMALLHPDTSAIPLWRRPAHHHEAPIKAWRCWDLASDDMKDWFLASVAAGTKWEGPVLRSNHPPLDPKVWDKAKRAKAEDAAETTAFVFNLAGIHAVKTLKLALATAFGYGSEVYGEVTLWGRVAQFARGYRAEYCMIKKLYLRRTNAANNYEREIIESLTRRYQCDVEKVAN